MTKHLLILPLLAMLAGSARGATTDLVPLGSSWKYLLGTAEASTPSAAWRQLSFNDASWPSGVTPIGYGETDIQTTISTSTVGNWLSVYMRKTFNVTNPSQYSQVDVTVIVDDGAVVWVNGVEVGRINVPERDLFYNDVALLAEERRTLAVTITSNLLVAGQNIIAVHSFNANLASSDHIVDASISASLDDVAPTVVNVNPPSTATVRTLTEIEVTFSELVTNVQASDLLVNGTPATGLRFGSPTQYVFEFPQPPTGAVAIAFAPGHGITDLAGTHNAFAGASFNYVIDPNAPSGGVIISEIMAKNNNSLNDEDGDSSDWIELHNISDTSANLNGWYLTDEAGNLTKWRIPNITLLANEYIVIFASGKNRTNISSGRLHTNFQLNDQGEYLGLVDSTGSNVVSEFAPTFPVQDTDVSYGRDRAVPTISGYFVSPTPNAPNSASGSGFSPEVTFSRKSGTFLTPFSLVLSTPGFPTAVIRYTTTTNFPTPTSQVYTGAIPINGTAVVRARAFVPNFLPGPPRSEHYIQLSTAVAGVTSDLPLMILHDYGGGAVPTTGERFVVMQIFDTKNGRSALTNAPDTSVRARFRLRGSSTEGYAKGSFALETWDEFSDDLSVSLLGLPTESDWVLYAPNNFDVALFHNPLAYQLSRDVGRYASRTRFVEVYLKDDAGVATPGPVVAGDYNGIYVLEERVKIDPGRVDIDRLEPENLTPPTVTGGYLLKIDRADPGDTPFTGGGVSINFVDPKGEQIRTPQRDAQEQYIIGYFNAFGTALNGANYRDPTNGYAKYIDLDAAIDHHILNVLTFNVDALRLSGYFYKTRDEVNDRGEAIPGKIVFGPVWDFDRTQGSSDGRDFNPRTWRSPVSDFGTDFFNYPWWARMFTDPDFWQRWIDRWEIFREGPLSTNHIFGVIDSLAAELKEAQPREQAKWNIVPRSGSVTAGGYTYNFGTGKGYQSEIDWKKEWYSQRINFIDGQFLDKPVLSHTGGMVTAGFGVTLGGPQGATVYYTTDGTDPRAPGGAVAANALIYTAPIIINANTRIVARSRDLTHVNLTGANNPPISSPWSGVSAASYIIATPRLVVTEIMFHPRDAEAGNTNEADNFEYLELKNVGNTTLNLVGVQITNAIDFTFTANSPIKTLAPGARVLLVNNQAAFAARYGSLANVGGEYLGSLDNAGERITIIGSLLEPILDFTYSDSWYPVTDGSGFSLVIVNENAPITSWSSKSSWRVSANANGSPGADDPAAPSIPAVVVNEALTHTDLPSVDAIELYNPTALQADISGWFLTDTFSNPRKYRIPDQTIIPAGGYRVFYETNFNAVPGGPNSFSLSSKGDAVYLFSGNGTDVTGYAHGFDFGASINGATFGRYITSTGGDQFPTQVTPTLGATNSGPKIGPVEITEINYHPVELPGGFDNADDEYIELYNNSDSLVQLFDPSFSTNTWRLRGAVDFEFPFDSEIAARTYILLVDFNPTNSTDLVNFRTRNNVSASVPIFGPFRGKLDNSGEAVELLRPDSPEPPPATDAGFVPYPLVERVTYSDAFPWPVAADGFGPSLQRISTSAYANDPHSWSAAAKTPGAAYGGGVLPVVTNNPANRTIVAYQSATFSVGASGPGLSYQWRFNGATIPGATSSALTLTNVQPLQGGLYDVVVLNSAGAVSSSNATLTVLIPASIIQQPRSVSVRPGTNITLSVGATSSSSISYQWRKNGLPINGATSSFLTLNNIQASDHATYDVVLTDAVGPVASAAAKVTVLFNPVIVVAPQSTTNYVGSTIVLAVETTGTLPMGYRWRKGGTTVQNQIIDSHTSFLVLTNVQLTDAASYTVVITNEASFSPGLLSAPARVVIVAAVDADSDGLPDDYENSHGLNSGSAADAHADPDHDGMDNTAEFIAGTDPQNGQSYLKVDGISGRSEVTITFVAVQSKTYTVQYRDGAGPWKSLAGVVGQPTTRTITVTDSSPPVPGARYYRIATPGVPEGF